MNLLMTYFGATAGLFAQTLSRWAKPDANGASSALEASRGALSSVFESLGTAAEGLTEAEVSTR
jgi:hypothetical protein